MKNNNNFIIILCFLIIFNFINHEAYANYRHDSGNTTFSRDSLLRNTEIDLRLNYGFFVHHHNEMTAYPARFPMFELSLQKQTYGKSLWQSHLNYPTVGVSAFYSSLGNIDIIGNAYALYPFINFPFTKSKINTFGFRFGIGVGYITKKYNPGENFRNTSIGSHINAAISLTFEYKRQISERLKLSAFAGLTHFSNGCSSTPNSGINIINAGAGLSYMLSEPNNYIPKPKVKTSHEGIDPEYYLGMSFGIKRIIYNQRDNYAVYDLEFYAMDRIGEISKIGISMDLVYNKCNYISVGNYFGYNKKYNMLDILKPGIGIAYELLMGDFSFLVSIGFQTYKYNNNDKLCYQKLGAKLNLGKYLYGKIALNTHFGTADFIGFGLGVRL